MADRRSPSRAGLVLALVLAIGAIGVVLFFVASPLSNQDRYQVPKELVVHVTALACVVLALIVPGWRIEWSRLETLFALYLLWSGISAVAATNHWLALRAWGLSFSGIVLFLAAGVAKREGAARLLLGALVLAAAIVAVTGLVQAYVVGWGNDYDAKHIPGGTLGNRNYLGHLAVIVMPLAALVAVRSRNRWEWWCSLAALGLLATIVVLTRSRAAWLAALAVGVIVGVAARYRAAAVAPKRWTSLAMVGVLLGGVAAALVIPNRLDWRADAPYQQSVADMFDYQNGSGRGRLIQYRNTLNLVGDSPVLGTGPGNWVVEYPRVTTPGDPSFGPSDFVIQTTNWPNSDWIAVLAERGVLGFALFLALGLCAAWRAARTLRDPEQGHEAVTVLGLLIAAQVCGLFDAVLTFAAPLMFVSIALGLLLPAGSAQQSFEMRGWRRLVGLGPLLVSLVVTLQLSGQLAALIAMRVAGSSKAEQVAIVRSALTYDPGNVRLHVFLVQYDHDCDSAREAMRLFPYLDTRLFSACLR